MTSLIGGQRVLKCDDRVEAYGTLDELSAFIGVLYDTLSDEDAETRLFLMEIQKFLMTVEAVEACTEDGMVFHLDESALLYVDERSLALEKELPPFRSFVIPGGNLSASYCHVCRTVCRRAERAAVKIGIDGVELCFLNRLSDYFFLLSRKLSFK